MLELILARYPFLSFVSLSNELNVSLEDLVSNQSLFFQACRNEGLEKVLEVIEGSLSEMERIIDETMEKSGSQQTISCRDCEFISCISVCPEKAIGPEGVRNYELCSGCGRCLQGCDYLEDFINIERLKEIKLSILSFYFSLVLVGCAGDGWLKRRFAIFESKRAGKLLNREDDEILKIISKNLGVRAKFEGNIRLHISDFLKVSSSLREGEWKLFFRDLAKGYVTVTKSELIRALEEIIRIKIEESFKAVYCDELKRYLKSIDKKLKEVKKSFKPVRFEKVDVESFPPCIKRMIGDIRSGINLPHSARFALTSFLLNTGMSVEDVVAVYKASPDFDEERTRYQVNHIRSGRGEIYTPPSCQTMKSYHNCFNPDRLCGKISHPLSYYEVKLKTKRKRKG
jgi:DNA primase large subunit